MAPIHRQQQMNSTHLQTLATKRYQMKLMNSLPQQNAEEGSFLFKKGV